MSPMRRRVRSKHTYTGYSEHSCRAIILSVLTFSPYSRPNISLSGTRRISIIEPTVHLPYIPPHPQRGTPYHRYVLLLLPHPSPAEPLSIPVPSEAERLGFDLRSFIARWGLDQAEGGGAHMWREVWDENVSDIYRDTLSKSYHPFPLIIHAHPGPGLPCFHFSLLSGFLDSADETIPPFSTFFSSSLARVVLRWSRSAGASIRQATQVRPLCGAQAAAALCVVSWQWASSTNIDVLNRFCFFRCLVTDESPKR